MRGIGLADYWTTNRGPCLANLSAAIKGLIGMLYCWVVWDKLPHEIDWTTLEEKCDRGPELPSLHSVQTFSYRDQPEPEEAKGTDHRPKIIVARDISSDDDDGDHEGESHQEKRERPFTLDFLKRTAREAETLDQFLAALRSYKEARAYDSNA